MGTCVLHRLSSVFMVTFSGYCPLQVFLRLRCRNIEMPVSTPGRAHPGYRHPLRLGSPDGISHPLGQLMPPSRVLRRCFPPTSIKTGQQRSTYLICQTYPSSDKSTAWSPQCCWQNHMRCVMIPAQELYRCSMLICFFWSWCQCVLLVGEHLEADALCYSHSRPDLSAFFATHPLSTVLFIVLPSWHWILPILRLVWVPWVLKCSPFAKSSLKKCWALYLCLVTSSLFCTGCFTPVPESFTSAPSHLLCSHW